MKTKWQGNGIIALFIVFAIGLFLLKFSVIRYPFIDARSWLAGHLKEDFAITLPTSATVLNSYWVGSRDPEEVFEVQMSPSDTADLANQMRTTAKTRGYSVSTPPDTSSLPGIAPWLVHPPYGAPTWWNNPPLPNAAMFTVWLGEPGHNSDYGILYSSSTGKAYIYWGRS